MKVVLFILRNSRFLTQKWLPITANAITYLSQISVIICGWRQDFLQPLNIINVNRDIFLVAIL